MVTRTGGVRREGAKVSITSGSEGSGAAGGGEGKRSKTKGEKRGENEQKS